MAARECDAHRLGAHTDLEVRHQVQAPSRRKAGDVMRSRLITAGFSAGILLGGTSVAAAQAPMPGISVSSDASRLRIESVGQSITSPHVHQDALPTGPLIIEDITGFPVLNTSPYSLQASMSKAIGQSTLSSMRGQP